MNLIVDRFHSVSSHAATLAHTSSRYDASFVTNLQTFIEQTQTGK